MKLYIEHETTYEFEEAANHSIQYLRLSPRRGANQFVNGWSVHSSGKLTPWRDGFGNDCHTSIQDGKHDEVTVVVEGEVETIDTNGILPADDANHPLMFLRETDYTKVDGHIHDFASDFRSQLSSDGPLDTMHALMKAIENRVSYEEGFTSVESSAADAFEKGAGVCQDHAHIFIACCRVLSLPSRYISGYMLAGDGAKGHLSSHAWAETLIQGLGWVSFDPANQRSATDIYVRIAVGFDYDTASPIRGVRRGGGSESLSVRVSVDESAQ